MILSTAAHLLLALALQLPGQTGSVHGAVRSQGTGAVLPGATVEVLDARPARAVAADGAGEYRLDDVAAGRRTIRARLVGYAPLELEVMVPAGREVEVDIALRATPIVLAPVEVGGAGRGTARDTSTAPPRDLAMAGARVLQSSPGLAELGIAEVAQGVPGQEPPDPSDVLFVRGTGADLKLVYLDGAPVYAPFPLGGLLQPFPPGLLSSAEVYLGGAPARYDGGLSYILDLRTRAARPDRVRAAGGVDGLSTRGMIEIPMAPGVGVLASGRAVRDLGAGWVSGESLPYGYQEGLVRTDLSLGRASSLSVTAFGNGERVWLDSVRTASRAIQWGNASVSARYSGGVGRTRLEVTGALADFRARLPVSGPATPLAEGASRRARLSADAVSRIESLALRYGMSVEEQRQSYRVRVVDDTERRWEPVGRPAEGREAGAYVDVSLPLGSRLMLRSGLRADHFSLDDELLLAPRSSLTLLLTEGAALTLAAGRYHQYVRPPETEVFTRYAGSPLLSPVPLALARATHVSLGLDQEVAQEIRFGLEGFFKAYEGVPGGVSSEANASGVDVWLRGGHSGWQGWLGYSLSWTWTPTAGSTSNRFAGRHLLSSGLSAPLGGSGKLDFGLVYGAGLPYSAIPFSRSNLLSTSPPTADAPAYDTLRQVEAVNVGNAPLLPTPSRPYLRLDLAASRTWSPRWGSASMELTPYIRLLNTLGQRDALFYRAAADGGDAFEPVVVLPVVPLLGVEWKF